MSFTQNCPHCGQPFEAENEWIGMQAECPNCTGEITVKAPGASPAGGGAGNLVSCPFCGEEILAVAKKCKHCGEFLDGSQPARRDAAPSPASQGPEKDIWTIQPSHLHFIGNYLVGGLLLFAGAVLSLAEVMLLVFVGGLGMVFILLAVLSRKYCTYTLSTMRVKSTSGIIARSVHEVLLRDIRSVSMSQSISDRLFGLGKIEVGSAGTGGIEIRIVGVKNPLEVKNSLVRQKDLA